MRQIVFMGFVLMSTLEAASAAAQTTHRVLFIPFETSERPALSPNWSDVRTNYADKLESLFSEVSYLAKLRRTVQVSLAVLPLHAKGSANAIVRLVAEPIPAQTHSQSVIQRF